MSNKIITAAIKDSKDSKKQMLDLAMAQISKNFGQGSIMFLGQKSIVNSDVISTGSILLDHALGVGGFAKGRITEIYGPEASGKTTIALQAIAEVQKNGGNCAIIDAEHALDPVYCSKLGIKTADLIISQPDYGEQALDIVELLVRSNSIDLIVVDSVAALVPKAELEGDMGDSHIGLQARLMSQALRKLTPIVHKSNTALIFINQIRHNINTLPFANKETTTGGNALKFYSSLRLEIRKIQSLKKNEDIYGNRISAKVVKNKMAPPFKKVELDLIFGVGISKELSLISAGLLTKVITQAGSWFSFEGQKLSQGKEALVDLLKSNYDLFKKIDSQVREALKNKDIDLIDTLENSIDNNIEDKNLSI
jgi:recombination protein RecA